AELRQDVQDWYQYAEREYATAEQVPGWPDCGETERTPEEEEQDAAATHRLQGKQHQARDAQPEHDRGGTQQGEGPDGDERSAAAPTAGRPSGRARRRSRTPRRRSACRTSSSRRGTPSPRTTAATRRRARGRTATSSPRRPARVPRARTSRARRSARSSSARNGSRSRGPRRARSRSGSSRSTATCTATSPGEAPTRATAAGAAPRTGDRPTARPTSDRPTVRPTVRPSARPRAVAAARASSRGEPVVDGTAETEVLAEGRAGVAGAVDAALLELRDQPVDDVVEPVGDRLRREVDAVDLSGPHGGRQPVGDRRRRPDERGGGVQRVDEAAHREPLLGAGAAPCGGRPQRVVAAVDDPVRPRLLRGDRVDVGQRAVGVERREVAPP